MDIHTCPVCGRRHEVVAVLHRLAYGRQLTCSPHCKQLFPALARARILADLAASRPANRSETRLADQLRSV